MEGFLLSGLKNFNLKQKTQIGRDAKVKN